MRTNPRNRFLAGFMFGFFLLCITGLANATTENWVMQKFYIQIDNVTFTDGDFNYWMSHSNYFGPAGGEKYYGSIEYDSSTISATGIYMVGMTSNHPNNDPVDEFQNWSFRMQSIFGNEGTGFGSSIYNTDPVLKFYDGQLVGIDCGWTEDVYGWGGPAIEYLKHKDYYAWGELSSFCQNAKFIGCNFTINGSLHLIPSCSQVPEPATILLLGLGLACLAGIRKKIC